MKSNQRTVMQSRPAASDTGAEVKERPSSTAQESSPTTGERAQLLPTRMTFATLRTARGMSLGIRDADQILDVAAAAAYFKTGAPTTIDDVLHRRGEVSALPKLLAFAQKGSADKSFFIATADAKFGPCVTNPEKIICVGLNYRSHAAETNGKLPLVPILFNKYNSALNYHGGHIAVSKEKIAKQFDDEGEQWMVGKSGDGWAPIGPWLFTADQIDSANLKLETRVNGEVRQSSNTSRMIFDCKTLVSFISQRMTLRPGDIIFTGTPEGVILGYPRDKQVWLKRGDRITTSIEKLGDLEFKLT
jgi:2-keto-4-pentenoate hydratase/2-oxohepta-3-ene-1,7-dioic acid hydratase in catechol pathway